jgi:hypothetical protein
MSIQALDAMHDKCLTRMKIMLQQGDKVKFWTLAQVDIRILQAKLKLI